MYRRRNALYAARIDPRLWQFDEGGGFTGPVLAAAAVAKCTEQGFDVDDLVVRAAEFLRPDLRRIHEVYFTEAIFECQKCGARWHESKEAAHKPGC